MAVIHVTMHRVHRAEINIAHPEDYGPDDVSTSKMTAM